MTKAWAGSSSSYTFPDYSSTTGWNSAWDFPQGQSASASIGAIHTSLGLSGLYTSGFGNVAANVPDGATVAAASRQWSGMY